MRILLIALFMTNAIAAAEAGSDIEGVWAYDAGWCANVEEPTPITITSDRIIGYEKSCEIISRSEAGDAVKLDLDCFGEGMKYRDSTVLLTVGGYLVRIYPDDGSVLVFTRCK
jgi:hypothetical protein